MGWPWPLAQSPAESFASRRPRPCSASSREVHTSTLSPFLPLSPFCPLTFPGPGTAARPYGARRESRPSPGNASRPPAMALAGRRSGGGGGGGAAGPAVSVAAAGPGPGSAGAPPGAAGEAPGTASLGSVVRLCGRLPIGGSYPASRVVGRCREFSALGCLWVWRLLLGLGVSGCRRCRSV